MTSTEGKGGRPASAVDRLLERGGASGRDSIRFLARVVGFAIGNQSAAEAFITVEDEPLPGWLTANGADERWFDLALRVASASKAGSQAAVSSLQAKISGLLSLMTLVFPAALAATGASVAWLDGASGAFSFVFFFLADVSLLLALLFAGLGSGLLLTKEVSLTRLSTDRLPLPQGSAETQFAELRLREIHALHQSAWLAMHTSTRLAQDLCAARRLAVLGALMLGLALLIAWIG